jgi:hypothetical protein
MAFFGQDRANGLRYRRLGSKRLENAQLPKPGTNFKKSAESQPSGARFVGLPSELLLVYFPPSSAI